MKTALLKSYKHANKYKSKGHQLTVQNLLNGRISGGKNKTWVKVRLTDEFREQLIEDLINVAGGHAATRERMKSVLTYGRPQHWALGRMIISDYGNGPKMNYCAGQDYPSELNQLRRELTK